MQTLELAALVLALGLIALVGVSTVATGVPPLPTAPGVRRLMLAMLPDRLDGPIHELGAGWGGLALALARRYPDVPVIAHERALLPWLVLRVRHRLSGCANLAIRRGDIFTADLHKAGLAVCFLDPERMRRLKPKFQAELPPGALVVTNSFAVPGWRPVDSRRMGDLYRSAVLLYRVGVH